tara:strand:+ start:838 stop:1122 length:285 start_codon:yes stop_codon:yes gene_type:complete
MNKILPGILVVLLNGCVSDESIRQLEKCADSMFILTNELMAERLPGEAQPETAIREFLSQSYNVKTEYDYYNALIKICEDQRDNDLGKFKEDYR